ncbi:MAG TPA: hypothetical protein VJ860_02015, partial [Polyangia bacterium]|nr:hypothetical protein [Polyangia bacterium]
AGRGDEGDDPATLEEAEDALAGALDDLLDILLRGCGRGMEYLALAVSVWRVNTGTSQSPARVRANAQHNPRCRAFAQMRNTIATVVPSCECTSQSVMDTLPCCQIHALM